MILAAGMGTRLRPLTDKIPKALVKAGGVPLLEIAIKTLRTHGFYDVIINVHHHAEKIMKFVRKKNFSNVNITISDERQQLMDTGGGIKKAAWFFDDKTPFVVYNVDIISDLNIKELFIYHQQKGGLATLAVQDRDSSRYLVFDKEDRLCGWGNKQANKEVLLKKNDDGIYRTGFSGIHVISPAIFEMMEDDKPFSIVDLYLRMAEKHNIYAYAHDGYWKDTGRKEKLDEAAEFVKSIKKGGLLK